MVVRMAKRSSGMASMRGGDDGRDVEPLPSRRAREGDSEVRPDRAALEDRSLQRRTASIDARHGWTCKGYENMTRTTIAALPTVEASEGRSDSISKERNPRKSTYTFAPDYPLHYRRKTSIL